MPWLTLEAPRTVEATGVSRPSCREGHVPCVLGAVPPGDPAASDPKRRLAVEALRLTAALASFKDEYAAIDEALCRCPVACCCTLRRRPTRRCSPPPPVGGYALQRRHVLVES